MPLPLPLHPFSPLLFSLPFISLCVSHHRRSFLTIIRVCRILLIPRSFLWLTRPGPVSFWSVIKLLFYAMRARNYERKGDLTGPHFVNVERKNELIPGGTFAR